MAIGYTSDYEMQLLAGDPIKLNDYITLTIPSLRQIKESDEKEYSMGVSKLCATSYDIKLYLYDMNIDYEDIKDYDVFLMLYRNISPELFLLLLGVDLTKCEMEMKDESIILTKDGVQIFDRFTYTKMVQIIRDAHGFQRNYKIAGNKFTKQFYIDDDRKNLKKPPKEYKSALGPYISSMVNTSGFKYNYSTVWDITMYQLIDAVKRIGLRDNYKNIMNGVYTGNIKGTDVSKKELDWLRRFD